VDLGLQRFPAGIECHAVLRKPHRQAEEVEVVVSEFHGEGMAR
jgi:hypothetical protein